MSKLTHYQCYECGYLVVQEQTKFLVIPVISVEASGMRVEMRLKPLCPRCYDDYYYYLHEDWMGQKAQKVNRSKNNTSSTPPDPSPPPGGRGSLDQDDCDHRFHDEVDGYTFCATCDFTVESGPSKAGAGDSPPPADPEEEVE